MESLPKVLATVDRIVIAQIISLSIRQYRRAIPTIVADESEAIGMWGRRPILSDARPHHAGRHGAAR
jgi:hypothetical protein